MNLRFDRAAEERFLNKPAIAEAARLITEFAKARYSDGLYAQRDIKLHIRWSATEAFRAGAFVAENGDHEIRLSYGTAIDIYRDAFVLPETCQRVLTESVFDPIFDLLSYGNERKDVLPAGLGALDAKVEIIRLMTTWLYLHEQAHLLQRHGEVAMMQGASELLSDGGGINDGGENTQTLEGHDAALRHAFEFAADYEAITNLVMVESIGMNEARLWCLAAGMMCMFQRFYGSSAATVDDVPRGSHPHPAVRMRMAMNRIEQIFSLPDFAAASNWSKGAAQARAVMDHAVYTADVFWHLRYLGLDARTPFLDLAVANLNVAPCYQRAVYEVWQSARPRIVAGHFGHGEGVVMFLREPSVIGSRN
jgi:hypothetical protein